MEKENTVGSSRNKEAWLRYFARIIDITVGSIFIVVGIIIISLFLLMFDIDIEALFEVPFVFEIILMIIYFFVEAKVISVFGTTLGKKLFGITVFHSNGEHLDYITSLERTFTMWFKGLGLSIPLISLFTLIMSYNRYTDLGITSWDEALEVKVSFQPISTIRLAVGVIAWVVAVALNLISLYIGT